MKSPPEDPAAHIDIGGNVHAAETTIGNDNVDVDAAVIAAFATLAKDERRLGGALAGCLPDQDLAPWLALFSGTTRRGSEGSSIRIGGNVVAGTVTIGSGNVKIGARSLIERVPMERLLDVLKNEVASDAILEACEDHGLSSSPRGSFERLVKPHRPELEPSAWRRKLAELETRVGRVERDGRPIGTGFLVGPDLVLTNFHVVEALLARGGPARDLAVRFDHGMTGVPERICGLAQDWCVDHSRYSRADHDLAAEAAWSEDELDHALLRLSSVVADDDVLGGRRGSIPLDGTAPVSAGDPLLVLQHPRGQRLKLCFGKVLSLNERRIRYDVNTDAGSSGSPCLNEELNLVGLHHMGDPNFATEHTAEFNQGIPIAAIVARLRTRSVGVT